jgi:hypothetical protein
MRALFPDLPAAVLFLGMSEIISHRNLFEDERRVAIPDETTCIGTSVRDVFG